METKTNVFTERENDLITKCVEEPDFCSLNINPKTKEVAIINNHSNKILITLGYNNILCEKLLHMYELNPTHKEISR